MQAWTKVIKPNPTAHETLKQDNASFICASLIFHFDALSTKEAVPNKITGIIVPKKFANANVPYPIYYENKKQLRILFRFFPEEYIH